MRAPATGLLPGWGGWHCPKAAHGFLCGSRPQTSSLARWVPPRDEDRPMAGKGVDSMAIKPVACNGPISAAHVHWAGFDLEARAAHENMLAPGAARTAADSIEGGSKGTEQGQQACGRVGRGVCRNEAMRSAGQSGSQGRPGEPSTRDATLEGRRCREIMASRFEGSALRQKESKSTTPPHRARPEGPKPESLWLTRPRLEQRKTLRIYVVHRSADRQWGASPAPSSRSRGSRQAKGLARNGPWPLARAAGAQHVRGERRRKASVTRLVRASFIGRS